MSTQASKRRLFRLNQSLTLLLVLGIAVALGLFAKKYHRAFDLTEAGEFTLSGETLKVLDELKGPVSITGFFQPDAENKVKFEDLIAGYRNHKADLTATTINPDQNPIKVKEYGIREYGTVYIEFEGRHIQTTELSEEGITNSLAELKRGVKQKIAVLSGHGERAIANKEQDGLSLMADELNKAHYEVEDLLLLQSGAIPEDLNLLIIPAPASSLLPKEIEILKAYLEKEGSRVLFLLDPPDGGGGSKLKPLLDLLPIRESGAVVIDPTSRLLGGDYAVPVVTQYPPHAITRDFQVATIFPLSQALEKKTGEEWEVWEVSELGKTGPAAWGETGPLSGEVGFDEGVDVPGPLALAIAMEKGKARFVAVGDGDFAANAYYDVSGNRDLLRNMIHWLASEENLISIHPKEKKKGEFLLTPQGSQLLFVVTVLLIPLSLVGGAIVVWRRRRRK